MIKILMCCSTLNSKGGMVSVVKNYLSFDDWGEYQIKYVPTHFATNKYILICFFIYKIVVIFFLLIFGHYELVHLHTAERGSFWRKSAIARLAHAMGVKVVMHHHAAEFEDFYEKCSEKQRLSIKKTLEMVDLNIVLSKRLIPMIKGKAPNANVVFLYNAVHTFPCNNYNANAKNVLFLGELGQRKGVYDLLQVILKLDDKIAKDIKFYLCGNGEVEKVRETIEKLGVQHRIAHLGWIDKDEKTAIFSNTMINALPSYNEGLPMTILETMAQGIPNISTSIASIPEVIENGKTGYMVQPGDVEELAKIIERLISDKKSREAISENSYKLVTSNFSLVTHIKALKVFYNDLVERK